jgi:hypothetical protein
MFDKLNLERIEGTLDPRKKAAAPKPMGETKLGEEKVYDEKI